MRMNHDQHARHISRKSWRLYAPSEHGRFVCWYVKTNPCHAIDGQKSKLEESQALQRSQHGGPVVAPGFNTLWQSNIASDRPPCLDGAPIANDQILGPTRFDNKRALLHCGQNLAHCEASTVGDLVQWVCMHRSDHMRVCCTQMPMHMLSCTCKICMHVLHA